MKRALLTIILLSMITILVACNDNEQQAERNKPNDPVSLDDSLTKKSETETAVTEKNENKAEEQEISAASLPSTLSELAALPSGYTGYLSVTDESDQKKIDELTKELPDISSGATENQLNNYYNELLAIFQQGFLGPEEIIAKMKFQALGNPDIEDPRMQFKDKLNVLVILDGSGSMGVDIGGQTQMAAAKKAIVQFVESLPEEANVGLRVYGHKGTGSSADKAMSCASSDLIYPLKPYEKGAFKKSLDQVKPAGWTPTELALEEAQKDLAGFDGENNTNIVYLVSDGVSTCDDNPVAAAKALYDSEITPIINIIGFNVDNDGQRQLKEMAKAVEGTYQDVTDAETLQNELDQATEIAEKWAKWKEDKEAGLENQLLDNKLEIFIYGVDEFGKLVDERKQVGFTLQYLYQTKKVMSEESYKYLTNRNTEYHQWINDEYEELKKSLRESNEMQFNEAIKALEKKYLKNSPD
ncbi:vWA domain-containing protein [Sporosarcina luteola]|uniref:vWA domain-containing protein n=1 Tax=Sporosarcina luteola TaxID=582850 RepID=UPI00203CD8AC|nr:VWA domain-containing protein [Sporosarcina luteola]MCM3708966.1 VWA domain-containing protein [Sporosarcina luteola]